jgi:hypothetical protein
MSDQTPHLLKNDYPSIDFGDLYLWAVIFGPVELNCGWGSGEYVHKIQPAFTDMIVTTNVSGYICEYHLTHDGHLVLDGYLYPGRDADPTPVHETLQGNFYLVMQKGQWGHRIYVPFIDGHIVDDPATWIDEKSLEIDMSSAIEEYENVRLNEILSISSKSEQAAELAVFITTAKSSRITKAIHALENILNHNLVGWLKTSSIATSIRKWPNEYRKEGQCFLHCIANQLLSQAKDPAYKWTRSNILKTIVSYLADTDTAKEAEKLLMQEKSRADVLHEY